MAKPEVHHYKSTGATCALDKDKIQMTEIIHDHGKKLIIIPAKNGRGNFVDLENRHLNEGYNNLDIFQTMLFKNPGGCKRVETPVIPTTMVEETKLPKNSYTEEDDDEVTDDKDEGESNTPPNTLMKEIQAAPNPALL